MLEDKLREEWPQILHWIIEGCALWQAEGLSPPDSIKAASKGYIQSQDVMGEFLKDCGTVGEGKTLVAEAWRVWCDWCDKNGERKDNRRVFVDRLCSKGPVHRHVPGFGAMIDGLTLRGAVP
jgi:putative DNA primase/helicase